MSLKEDIEKFQKVLVSDYRQCHPEETDGLSDSEVALMNPITYEEIQVIKFCKVGEIQRKIDALRVSIIEDGECLNDPNTWSERLSEIRADIRETLKEIDVLESQKAEYTSAKALGDYENDSRNR